MALLADLFQVFILVTCLIGLGLAFRHFLPSVPFGLQFCLAPLVLVAALFFIEHFVGLGQPHWVWLPGMALSCYLIHRAGRGLWKEMVLWYFFFGFGVCFFWRFFFPDIFPTSDNLADLALLVSNSLGKVLPADDIWVKGTQQDAYYIFQFYAGGLIHRFIGCNYGMTYHLAYCTIAGLSAAAIGQAVQIVTKSINAGVFACLTLVLGGNGATLFTPFMDIGHTPTFFASMRFIGSYAMPGQAEFQTDFGHWFVQFIGASKVEAPMEYFAYALLIGDYHPPLSSFLFLAIAILAICYAEVSSPGSLVDRICSATVMATPFFVIISDIWTAPLQLVLVACWFAYRWFVRRGDTWQWIFLTAFFSLVAIAPFFVHMAGGSPTQYTLARVPVLPPFLNWVVIMLPACVIAVACLFLLRREALARFVVILGITTMLGTYFFHIHDDYGGEFALYNTTMKMWPWVYTFVTVMGLICVWPHLLLRRLAILILTLSLIGNVYIFFRYWQKSLDERPDLASHVGRLDGTAWYTDDSNQKALFAEVKTLPKGVMMESMPPPDCGSPSLILAPYTENYSLAGYPWQEIQRRRGREDLGVIAHRLDEFYLGTFDQSAAWLRGIVPGGVTYVLWMTRDNARGPGIWDKINDQLKSDYDWRETNHLGTDHWGVWIQRAKSPVVTGT